MNFIDAHDFSVDLVLRVLGVAASTYYGWRARRAQPSLRARRDAELLVLIDEIRGQSEFAATYGSPRVWLELRKRGVRVGRKRVERIMRANGRQGAFLPKGWKHGSTRQNPKHTAAPDLLDRDFSATAPNQKWVADLTRIPTLEGVLWLASVRDTFSNKVVGWDSSSRATTELVCCALDYAIFSRDVRDGQLIHHSDKGCQYTSVRFTQRLVDAGIAPSTGSVGDSFDNALAENLWSTIKVELIYWPATTFATREQAQGTLFRYIDGWYNPRRIQAGLCGLSPDEYEAAWKDNQQHHPQAATLPLEGVGPK
ncbi:IS3 family transposase [Mycobacterium ostraviense]|nr:IS3 family transposase [Mycobacterium ostraviense]UGT90128.1 IS3 family transposase [Mycobacterium ostraviense]UGT90473.1 IS3 family transposase [Mycobacterium ostraviense]UGT91053.1 IS3 family transposase [Mycobacterium ostraviense]UGT91417.1 IS3 family transposase [Mycobacterium ostraviense]UGT92566.1 IS3 family transposase [Mycobacterium ostraviense]